GTTESGTTEAGTTEAGTTESHPPRSSEPAPEWAEILPLLDRARVAAYRTGDPDRLTAANAPGSPADVSDRALFRRYAEQGLRVQGMSTQLVAVEPDTALSAAKEAPAGSVVLTVADRRSDYQLLDSAGAVIAQYPAAGLRRWRVTVAPSASGAPSATTAATDSGWRVWEVVPVP
ncbi:MAG: hypothetical protein ACOYEV_15110, partial [Candidatus Nanopelagicales bacterium]